MPGTGQQSDGKSLVLGATDIVELIGQTVSLKRRGKDYVGLCPFHQEKTPSFHVSPGKQFFHCYGCKKGGNAIDFVIERDRVTFVEALKTLSQRAGIDLPRLGGSKEKQTERQALLDAHSAACGLFEKWLTDAVTGKRAREYLKSRGFTDESIQRFRLGLAVESWDALLKSPAMKNFRPDLLQQAGLIKERDGGSGFYDTFRNRLIFPIRDETGRIIAFGGRIMPGSEDPAKYLNSPETPLFSKSRSVFGLDLARQKIVETRTVAVVEGYTDVVMAHQYGATNVVSILGTAMTEQHVAMLRRFADRIVLLFDADTAGDLAVNRAVELFLTQPVEIAIASMPQGVDPDEYLLEHGVEGFNKLLGEAQDALTYKWKQLSREFFETGELTSQQRAVQEYLEVLTAARGSGPVDTLRWGAALHRVSKLTEIPVEQLHRRFGGAKSVPKRDITVSVNQEYRRASVTAQQKAERWLLGILLGDPSKWPNVQQHVQPEEFSEGEARRLAEIYWQHHRDEGEPVFAEFLDLLDANLKELAISAVEDIEALDEPTKTQSLTDALRHFEQVRRRKEEVQTLAELRRTSDGSQGPQTADKAAKSSGAEADEIALLRKLQEQARQRR